MIINKVKNSKSKNEFKVTFNYFRMIEKFFDNHLKLSSKIHDHLLNFRHEYLFFANLKHVYYIIQLHFENKHYFVFIISEIDQLQFIKIQQRFMFAEFIMTELIYRTFKFISSLQLKLSLLHSNDLIISSFLMFYMNDFFDEFKNFKK